MPSKLIPSEDLRCRSLANGKSVGAAAIACTIAWRRLRQTAFWSWEGRECAKHKVQGLGAEHLQKAPQGPLLEFQQRLEAAPTDGVEPKKDLCATRKRGQLTHGRIDEHVPSGMRSKMEKKRMAVVDKEGPDHSGCDSNQSSKRPRGQHTCH